MPLDSIYIHIPFCKKKCNYCDFNSISNLTLIDDFLNALALELKKNSAKINKNHIRSLYIGGGTPSALDEKQLKTLFMKIEDNLGEINKIKESVIEINPESLSEEKLKLIRDFGINRISLGLQSTSDRFLNYLGRLSNYDKFLKSYELIRKYNFKNVNLDLIFAVPSQKMEDLEKDLLNIVRLRPEHISAYCLEIHENTYFGKNKIFIDEDLSRDMYYHIVNFLTDNGYLHYEISNFSLNGFESIHNLNYWNCGQYLGFGPSACSHMDNCRWKNMDDVYGYIDNMNKGEDIISFKERLTDRDILNERLILGLRQIKGIELDGELFIKFKYNIEKLFKSGYIDIEGRHIKIKKDFLFTSNFILSEIML